MVIPYQLLFLFRVRLCWPAPKVVWNIEEVAKEYPDSIITEPVNINEGIRVEQAQKVAAYMGFENDKIDQVRQFPCPVQFYVHHLSK